MMAESIAVLITKPPYGTEDAFAGMRQALALQVSGLMERTAVLMMGEGALNALATQQPRALSMPSNAEAVEDLVALEAEVYVISEDLDALCADARLIEGVRRLDWEDAQDMLSAMDVVTTF